jgi:tetratricopeptide (TPR) repeat protein
MSESENGLVITFYSYKGGTGRTMALANTAWILASNGKRVLVTDWDLESPGLHRFFRPFLDPAAISATPGVIDLIREYQWATLSKEPRSLDYHVDYARVQKYAISLDWEFPDGGRLDFLSAGRQNRDYSNTVASINWDEFYEDHGGGLFFDALRADMRRNYDYALIDSRTGLSDVADICTVHLPDVLADCFTLSDQGIEGAAAIARSIAEHYPDRGIRILPVPMRIDEGEKEKVDAGRALARARFEGFPNGLSQSETARYWGTAEIPYRPFYAYEETLATFGDPPGLTSSILSAMERLTEWITDGAVVALPPFDEAERLRILSAFTRKRPPSPSDLLLAYVPEDRMWADWISAVLRAASFTVVPIDVTSALPPDLVEPSRHRSVTVLSPAFIRARTAVEFARAVAATDPSGSRRQLVPIVVGVVRPVSPLTDRIAADLTSGDEASAVESLLRGLDHPEPVPLGQIGSVRFPGSIPQVWNVQPRNASFTGRNSVLEHLRDQLATKAVSVVVPVALHGLGGVGKTQVALEYAHRFKADYDLVWWVDAEQPDQINRSLAELAPRLNIRVGESYADAAREVRDKLRLGDPYKRWLLIFDNADEPADLRNFLPGGPGHVLITSRNQSWTQVADPLEVDVFARVESTDLLLRRVPSLSQAEAQELAEVLGDLPLAVEVAGAWLADSGLPIGEYIASLQREGSTGVLSQTRPTDYPRSLEATWKISLDRLAERSQAALRLLELCAFFAPEISVELIYGPQTIEALLPLDGSLRVPMMFGRVIQEISRLALAKVDRQGNSIQVHRLVQSYLRDQMDQEKTEVLIHEVHRILTAARPQRGDTDEPKNWPQYQLIWPHLGPSDAASCDEEPVRQLLIDRVRYLWKSGDYDRGLALALQLEGTWKDALAGRRKQATAPEERELLQRQLLHLQSQRANIYRSQGEIALAAELDQEVLRDQRSVLPQDDLHTLITAGGMAADLRSLGRFAEALEIDKATYSSLKQIFGEDHERTLVAANNLGVDYRLNGDCFTALEYDQDTLERRNAVLGPAHPYTLSSKLHVARDLREAGDYQQSISILQSTYTEFIEVLDENYVESLRTATSLGTSLRYAGQHSRARTVTEETYARYEEEFNADTPDAYACRVNLAADLAATGELAAAIDRIQAVGRDYQRRFGEKHPFTLAAQNNHSVYLWRNNQGRAALDVALPCVEGFTSVLGPEHRYSITAQLTLANSYSLIRDYRQAHQLDEHVFVKLGELLKEEHPTVIAAGINLAHSLDAVGAAERGHALRRKMLAACLRILGDAHPTTAAARDGSRIDREIEPQPM